MLSQPDPHGGLVQRWLPAALVCALAAWPGVAESAAREGDRQAVEQAPQAAKSAAPSEPTVGEGAAAAAPKQAVSEPPPKATVIRPAGPPPEFRGPDITLIASEERTVYEFRQNGQLRMIKVVPKFGKPYYLAPRDPTTGFGDLEQADSLIAEWVLWEF